MGCLQSIQILTQLAVGVRVGIRKVHYLARLQAVTELERTVCSGATGAQQQVVPIVQDILSAPDPHGIEAAVHEYLHALIVEAARLHQVDYVEGCFRYLAVTVDNFKVKPLGVAGGVDIAA